MDLLGELPGGVLQRHDFLGEYFELILAVVDLSGDQDRRSHSQERTVFVEIVIHAEDLDRAGQVFHRGHQVRLVGFLGSALLDRRNQTGIAHYGAIFNLRQRRRRGESEFLHQRLVRVEGMAGNIESKQLLFGGQALVHGPLRQFHSFFGTGLHGRGEHVEQGALTAHAIMGDTGGTGQGAVYQSEHGGAGSPEGIAGAAF